MSTSPESAVSPRGGGAAVRMCEKCGVNKAKKKVGTASGAVVLMCVECLTTAQQLQQQVQQNQPTTTTTTPTQSTSSTSTTSTSSSSSPSGGIRASFKRLASKMSVAPTALTASPPPVAPVTVVAVPLQQPVMESAATSVAPLSPTLASRASSSAAAARTSSVTFSSSTSSSSSSGGTGSAVAEAPVPIEDAVGAATARAAEQRALIERKIAEHEEHLRTLKKMQEDFAPMYEMAPEMGEKTRKDVAAQERQLEHFRQALADHDRLSTVELQQASELKSIQDAKQLEAAEQQAAKKKAAQEKAAADAAERERVRKQREESERLERERLERELVEREKKLAEQRAREEQWRVEREQTERDAAQALAAKRKAEADAIAATTATMTATAVTTATTAISPASPRSPRSPRPPEESDTFQSLPSLPEAPSLVVLTPEAADADAAVVAALVQTMREPRVSLAQTAAAGRYAPLLELLPASSLLLVNAMCVAGGSTVEQEALVAVCCSLDGYNMLQDAITAAIAHEVGETAQEGTLFRSNSASTKLIGAYTRLCCQTYLCNLLRPIVSALTASGDDLEVDPMKCEEASARAHQQLLRKWADRTLAAVFDSLADMPSAMRWLAARIVAVCVRKFPDSKVSSAGGFLFLRFICPALAVPKARGVLRADPPPRTQRALQLVAKLLQALANNVNFSKEPYMMPFNSFIADNQAPWAAFVDKLIAVDLSSSGGTPLATALDADSKHLPYIHAFICKHVDKVKQSLTSYQRDATAGLVDKALATLGAPPVDAKTLESYAAKIAPLLASPPESAAAPAAATTTPASDAAATSPRSRKLGLDLDVKAGLALRISYQLSPTETVTKTVRAEFADTVAALQDAVCGKFDLAASNEYLELYVPSPIDSVLKRDKTLNTYHFLAKPDCGAVELRWRPGVLAWMRYPTLVASKDLPTADRVRELKMRKMVIVGLAAKRDVAAKQELTALDELLATLEDSKRTMITKPIDRSARRRAQTSNEKPAEPPRPQVSSVAISPLVSPRARTNTTLPASAASSTVTVSERVSVAASDRVASPTVSPRTRLTTSAEGADGRGAPARPNSPPPVPRLAMRAAAATATPTATPPPATPPATTPPPATAESAAAAVDLGGMSLFARAQMMRKAAESAKLPKAAPAPAEPPVQEAPKSPKRVVVSPLHSPHVSPREPPKVASPSTSPRRESTSSPLPPTPKRTTGRAVPVPPARIPRQDSNNAAQLPPTRVVRAPTPPPVLGSAPPLPRTAPPPSKRVDTTTGDDGVLSKPPPLRPPEPPPAPEMPELPPEPDEGPAEPDEESEE